MSALWGYVPRAQRVRPAAPTTVDTDDAEPTRPITTKLAIRRGLPLCKVCLSRWVAKAERVTCGRACERIYHQREAMRATNAKKTLSFPKEALL